MKGTSDIGAIREHFLAWLRPTIISLLCVFGYSVSHSFMPHITMLLLLIMFHLVPWYK